MTKDALGRTLEDMVAELTNVGLRNRQDAEDYDAFSLEVLQPWDDIFLKRCVQLRPVVFGTFVDVGAGTGVLLQRLSRSPAFLGWSLIGVEPFEDMVLAGRGRFMAERIPAEMILGDAHVLPFENDSVDMVASRATIHHLPDKPKALVEMFRVLRSGGVGLIHDARRDMPLHLRESFNRMRASVGYGPTTLTEKLTPDEMNRLLEQAGLSAHAELRFSDRGLEALGFEVVIRKP